MTLAKTIAVSALDQSNGSIPCVESAIKMWADIIEGIVNQGGPLPSDYPDLDRFFHAVHPIVASGSLEDLRRLRALFGEAMTAKTLQGYVCERPRGYFGDYEILDKIYTQHLAPEQHLAKWDQYFHQTPAARAARNRPLYLRALLLRHVERVGDELVTVLKIASGPGRNMFAFLTAEPNAPVIFDCIELDPAAIAYARNLNAQFAEKITFYEQNALHFIPARKYQVVWAAGIFDYFSDKLFVTLLRQLVPAVFPGGEIVIGNFAAENSTQHYMEFGGWNLHCRAPAQLHALALEAGVSPSCVSVDSEPERVNFFLRIAC